MNITRIMACLIAMGITLAGCQSAPETAAEGPFHDGIDWNSDNDIATYLAFEGIAHWQNIEVEKAYTFFEKATQVDSSHFASHTALALMSSGDKQDYHKMMAKKHLSEDASETSKLFVSLLDIENDSTAQEKRAAVWASMHELSNGPLIHFNYAITRSETEEVIAELDQLKAFLDELGMSTAHLYNLKGYMLNQLGDVEQGTAEIERYMELYPEGYNPFDSRAEFYLMAGDTASAVDYYKKARQQYPWATSARGAISRLSGE